MTKAQRTHVQGSTKGVQRKGEIDSPRRRPIPLELSKRHIPDVADVDMASVGWRRAVLRLFGVPHSARRQRQKASADRERGGLPLRNGRGAAALVDSPRASGRHARTTGAGARLAARGC
jgi:hypothetical protein